MPAGPPIGAIEVPAAVLALAGGAPLRAVWQNERGGMTFEVRDGRRFVKWAPTSSGLDLAVEAARLCWAVAFTPVPRVLEMGEDDEGAWLVTEALPGESAVSERWLACPAVAVRAIGEGLRALHDALPVGECPFDWSAQARLAAVQRRVAAGEVDPASWNEDHRGIGVHRALDRLADTPPVDHLVVCHGDACAPNTLLTDDGRWSGHVDFGALGVADRWADLAIATWSTRWNYGPGWERPLLDSYGVEPDPARIAYYRLLWDLGP